MRQITAQPPLFSRKSNKKGRGGKNSSLKFAYIKKVPTFAIAVASSAQIAGRLQSQWQVPRGLQEGCNRNGKFRADCRKVAIAMASSAQVAGQLQSQWQAPRRLQDSCNRNGKLRAGCRKVAIAMASSAQVAGRLQSQ